MIQTVRRLERRVDWLEEEIKRLTVDKGFLLKENKALRREINELKKKRTSKKPRVKGNTSGKKKKRGRKPGFEGTSRKKPDHVDEVVDVTLPFCPGCGAPLEESYEKRERYVEDIAIVRPPVTKYIPQVSLFTL